ncbi:MAG: cysteine hydrolase [Proteobacteria bacterium]|nr:cysteine hydrolase [Pseudomonadota bacterium]
MAAAILVIDVVNDTLKRDTPLSRAVRGFLPALNDFLVRARSQGRRVVFSTDSFLETDPLFEGRKKGWSIQGTEGARVAREIHQEPGDLWLPKRRWSAFFQTDLDRTLRQWGVDVVGVAGVTTHFCVLSTALDAFAHDFRTVIIEDLCASFSEPVHRTTLENLRAGELNPYFRIMTGDEFLADVG